MLSRIVPEYYNEVGGWKTLGMSSAPSPAENSINNNSSPQANLPCVPPDRRNA